MLLGHNIIHENSGIFWGSMTNAIGVRHTSEYTNLLFYFHLFFQKKLHHVKYSETKTRLNTSILKHMK